jgi:hypothetical protein
MQLHGIFDMKAWFKLNSLIMLQKEHGQNFVYLLKFLNHSTPVKRDFTP